LVTSLKCSGETVHCSGSSISYLVEMGVVEVEMLEGFTVSTVIT